MTYNISLTLGQALYPGACQYKLDSTHLFVWLLVICLFQERKNGKLRGYGGMGGGSIQIFPPAALRVWVTAEHIIISHQYATLSQVTHSPCAWALLPLIKKQVPSLSLLSWPLHYHSETASVPLLPRNLSHEICYAVWLCNAPWLQSAKVPSTALLLWEDLGRV